MRVEVDCGEEDCVLLTPATRGTWLQDLAVAMTGAERAGAGSGAQPGPTGCVRIHVHRRSPRILSPSRNTAVREEAKRGSQGSTESGKGPTVSGRWSDWNLAFRQLLRRVGGRALVVGRLVSGVLRSLF